MSKHNLLGIDGEQKANVYLKKRGYKILATNWTFRKAEIDIIAQHQGEIIFIEVKTRSTYFFGNPEDAVGLHKQNLLCKASAAYLEKHNINSPIRFDIISIVKKLNDYEIYHIQDAFFPIGF